MKITVAEDGENSAVSNFMKVGVCYILKRYTNINATPILVVKQIKEILQAENTNRKKYNKKQLVQ